MLRNYVTIAMRNLRRHTVYSFINIVGLAMGLSCCILIFLFIRHEWTYDLFHLKARRLYRVNLEMSQPSGIREITATTPAPLGPALKAEFPEVEQAVHLTLSHVRIQHKGDIFEESVLFADPVMLDMFTFPLLKGNPAAALQNPNSIVLTEHIAQKYFGAEDPMGKRLSLQFLDETRDFIVTGVAHNIPSNSSIQFGTLCPFENAQYNSSPYFRRILHTSWDTPFVGTFIQLTNSAHAADVEAKLPGFAARHFGVSLKESRLRLQALPDIHLNPDIKRGFTTPSNPLYSYILAGIALIVLLIACVNFMTLAVGRSMTRAKEVGVRKVVGARRGQLMGQFWAEAIVTSLIALFIGAALAELLLPPFNTLAGKSLRLDLFKNGETLLVLLGLALIVGLVAGSYPAVVLSRFNPISVLTGRLKWGERHVLTRCLVVTQFTLSIALIVCTLVMSKQLDYLRMKPLGFKKEQVVIIEGSKRGGRTQVYERFRDAMTPYTQVKSVTSALLVFGEPWSQFKLKIGQTDSVMTYTNFVDSNFLQTLGIELVDGRNFSKDLMTDIQHGAAVLVNEALVRAVGGRSIIGKELSLEGERGMRIWGMRVIGVVKNFHFRSLHHQIEPLILVTRAAVGGSEGAILVRIAPNDIPRTLAHMETVWRTVAPDVPFTYSFLDEIVDQQYREEQRWGQIVRYTAIFAILIACFGLFGLATLAAGQRTKEISIRKVLGASVSSLVLLLSRELVALVVVANLIAWPVAYYAMSRWLQDFAYRIEIGVGTFVLAALLALAIALLTVSYHAIKAAFANPVEALRYE